MHSNLCVAERHHVLHKGSKCLRLEPGEVPWGTLCNRRQSLLGGTVESKCWDVVYSGQNPCAPIPRHREALGFLSIPCIIAASASAVPERSVRGSRTTGQHSQPCGNTRIKQFHGQSMKTGSGPQGVQKTQRDVFLLHGRLAVIHHLKMDGLSSEMLHAANHFPFLRTAGLQKS